MKGATHESFSPENPQLASDLLNPTAFGKLNRNRNRASSQNVRPSIYQDRLDVGGVGVEHENSVHKIATSIQLDHKSKRRGEQICRALVP